MMNGERGAIYPWHALVPKTETEAMAFIHANPDFDGRNIVVGILDTGVDPGAIGLQLTSTGLPKVIDIIDCSGSGDVAMSSPILAEDFKVRTSDGRELSVSPDWRNPSGMYRVGKKKAFELYPRGLQERVLAERNKSFLKAQNEIELNLRKQLALAKSEEIEDLKTQIALLKSLETNIEDIGPVYDCLTFHDGERWQAVVNTSESDEGMKDCEVMTDFRVHRQYRRFSDVDMLNFCVNIYDEGGVLSICVDAGAHGSHVAGIVAAFHPDQPELNGIAPGAQIVSLKIGDSRLGSMETGVSLTRAILEAKRRGCDIINMSYGEATAHDDKGYFTKLAEDLVINHNIVFVASAGNNGPALSTVGCPGGTSSCCIGVGAFVSQNMMTVAYSMIENTPETNFTWSSVGPCIDGDLGVSVMAPGAAVTSVPNWTLQKSQLMQGTSMSSPNACGCITLLLSAARGSQMKVSTAAMRRAIQNSAKFCEGVDVLGQGYGLLQVDQAWKMLQRYQQDNELDMLHYKVTVLGDRFKRGIYLRGDAETSVKDTYKVQVDAIFRAQDIPSSKINFEKRLCLVSSESWISCPPIIALGSSGKTFSVSVDPSELSSGLHVGFISAFEDRATERGVLFKLPITVTKPEMLPSNKAALIMDNLSFEKKERFRRFFIPPAGCSFLEITVKDCRKEGDGDTSPRLLVVHGIQLFPGVPYRDNEKKVYLTMLPGSSEVISMAVESGVCVELVFARLWSSSLTTVCSAAIEFRGVRPIPSQITILGGDRVSGVVQLMTQLSTASIAPVAKLDKWRTTVKPKGEGKVFPLGERDILLDGVTPLYQLVLEYEIEISEATEVSCHWPALQGILYESDFHGQFFMVFDESKKLLSCGDAWPKKKKLPKGKLIVRLQVRHEKAAVLEKVLSLPMVFVRALKNAITITAYKTKSEALVGAESGLLSGRSFSIGSNLVLYFKEPSSETLPKGVSNGDILTGSVTYMKKEPGKGDRPGGYKVDYVFFDCSTETNGGINKKDAISSEKEKFSARMKEAKMKHIKGLVGDPAFVEIADLISADYPEDISLKALRVNHFNKLLEAATPSEEESITDACLLAIDDVIQNVNSAELAQAFGVLTPVVTKNQETQKAALVMALGSKAKILISRSDVNLKEFEDVMKELQKWASLTDHKYWRLMYGKHMASKNWGLALKVVSDAIFALNEGKSVPDTGYDTLLKECVLCLRELGWTHLLERCLTWVKAASKSEYDLF